VQSFLEKSKERTSANDPPKTVNDPPKADAGPDVLIGLSCEITSSVAELVGIHSSDPDNNIVSYNWIAINRQLRYVLSDSLSSNAKVKVFCPGEYRFELTVTDAGGLSSKDTVLVNVKGTPGIPMQYDLDMTFTTRYTVGNYNYYDPWENPDSSYYTTTEVQGTDTLLPFGKLQISIYQYADTAALNDSIYNSVMNIMKGDYQFYLSGGWSVINFKKFIRSGGGPFAGTFTVGSSSAQTCIGGINTRLPPLAITGNLDVHSQTITLSIKGKVFF